MRSNFKDIDLIVYTGDSVRHDKDKSFKRIEEQVLDGHGRRILSSRYYGKFSVLNLNSMYFYKKNKLLRDCDIMDSTGALQLKWLERELKNARDEGRRIYTNEMLYSPAWINVNWQIFAHNPAIRQYAYSTRSRDFGSLKDYKQYIVNLTEANEIGEAIWRLENKANKTYG
ncbi:3699_t:CDS:2, partial [Dentiscutata erythropus]